MDAEQGLLRKFWPVWVAVACPVLLVVLIATPLGPDFVFVVIGIPGLLLIWGCLAIWALLLSCRRVRRRDWLRALASAVLPLVVLGAGARLRQFLLLCNEGGDVVHFLAARPSYVKELRALPPSDEPRLVVFNRGGMIWASRGYVYDESDEVVREDSMRTANWRARAAGTELSCGFYARSFPIHFSFTQHWYLASFPC